MRKKRMRLTKRYFMSFCNQVSSKLCISSKEKLLIWCIIASFIYAYVYINGINRKRLNLLKLLLKPSDYLQGFQPVGDQFESYVYSAFYDNRSYIHIIHVVAIVQYPVAVDSFACLMWNPKENNSVVLPGVFEEIPDWRKPKYCPGTIKCSLINQQEYFTEISIVPILEVNKNSTGYPNNLLVIKYPTDQYQRNFTRCVPALYDFSDKVKLVQMIEIDRFLGTEHFIMYYFRNSPVLDILKEYQERGIVEVLPWNLPFNPSEDSIHYFGQFLQIHDCVYRNLYVSRYVFLADIDEVVASDKYNSWSEIVKVNLEPYPNCGSLSFRSAFFHSNVTTKKFPLKHLAVQFQLTFFLNTFRTAFYPHRDRSKVLLDPRKVWITKIHFVEIFFGWYSACELDKSQAYLHHYRQASDPIVSEDTTLLTNDSLIRNIVDILLYNQKRQLSSRGDTRSTDATIT